jgi:hypothetical protein
MISGTSYRFLAAAQRGRVLSLHEQARSGRWVRQFGTAKQPQQTKPHLYLVLDDDEHAFNIHRLDMDDDLNDGGSPEKPLRFPEPSLLRLGHGPQISPSLAAT